MYSAGGISATIYANRLRAEGMGSNEQAVPFSNQNYEALKQECVESGCLFEDPCFPAEPPSLGFKELAPYSSKTKDVEWMRPTVRKHVKYENILYTHTFYTHENMFLGHRLTCNLSQQACGFVVSPAGDDCNSAEKHISHKQTYQ